MSHVKRWTLVFSSAAILMFFSEFFFVNEAPAQEILAVTAQGPLRSAAFLLTFALWYALPTYLFLAALQGFRVRNGWGLVLAGSLYGFTVEGVLAQQMYEALPFSISWTPIGWHVLVDVLLGWYLVRRAMTADRGWMAAALTSGLGVAWGVWATWFGAPFTSAEFARLAFWSGGLWVLANLAFHWGLRGGFRVPWLELGVVLFLLGVTFGSVALRAFPLAALVLPAVLGLSLFALRRVGGQGEGEEPLLASLQGPVPRWRWALPVLTPLAAAATYPAYLHLGLALPLADLVVPLLMIAGFRVYGLSLWRAFVGR